MDSANIYGGDFVILPLRDMKKPGRGDDVVVDLDHGKDDDTVIVVDHEKDSRYGCLDIDYYKEDYNLARELATGEGLDVGGPIMIAVQDPESGSPVVLSKCVRRNGERYFLAIIFNAMFSKPDENSPESYCLRMTEEVDPERVFSERIAYAPGEEIAWEPSQLKMLNLDH